MATRKTREMRQALASKGFQERPGDHKYYSFYFRGKKTSVWTKFSHGSSEYGDSLLGAVKRQLKVTKQQMDDLFDCPLDEAGYARLLIDQGVIRDE